MSDEGLYGNAPLVVEEELQCPDTLCTPISHLLMYILIYSFRLGSQLLS